MKRFEGKKQVDRFGIKQPFINKPDNLSGKQLGAWNRLQAKLNYKEKAIARLSGSI